ncbi:MAG: glycosyltransferase family 2 protein [Acidimicrobiales bacterium]
MTEPAEDHQVRRSIVLPAHNEAELLERAVGDVVKAMRDRGETFEIVIVENGSTDGTGALAARLQADTPEIILVNLPVADYGAAVAKGFAMATGDVVVHFDVDYVDMGFLGKGIAIVDGGAAGIVLASKRAPGATDRRPISRRVLTAGFTFAMRVLLQLPVTDAHGMKVLSRAQCAEAARACTMTGALYDVELVLRASRAGVRVAELPADVSEVRPPRTSVWQRSIESATGLLRLRVLLWRERLRAR